jgi:hypothetical protein
MVQHDASKEVSDARGRRCRQAFALTRKLTEQAHKVVGEARATTPPGNGDPKGRR